MVSCDYKKVTIHTRISIFN